MGAYRPWRETATHRVKDFGAPGAIASTMGMHYTSRAYCSRCQTPATERQRHKPTCIVPAAIVTRLSSLTHIQRVFMLRRLLPR